MWVVAALALLAPAQVGGGGPLVAGQPLVVDARAPEGLWLSATLEAAYLDQDLWVGTAPGIGVELDAFALHLRVPLYLSLWDLPPARDNPAPACAFVRCAEWLNNDGDLRVESLSRVVDHLRVGRPGDWLHAVGGPLFVTYGTGRVLSRYLNSPDFVRRQSGLYAKAQAPDLGVSALLVVGNLIAPQELTAARVEVRPMRLLVEPDAWLGGLLNRARVAVDAGVDLQFGVPRDVMTLRTTAVPLVASALELAWPVLEEGGVFNVTPWTASGLTYGLSSTGAAAGEVGVGQSAGAILDLRVPFVGARVGGEVRLDGPAHRVGLFSTLYEVERRRTPLAAPSLGIASVPAPGGLGWALGGELIVAQWVRLGSRYTDDTAVGSDTLEAWAQVAAFGLNAGVRYVRRGVNDIGDVIGIDERTILVTEASVRFFGPLSVFGRWYRTPRVTPAGSLQTYDDVLVGISGDLVLSLGLDKDR